jgi:hypothetical protein
MGNVPHMFGRARKRLSCADAVTASAAAVKSLFMFISS